MSKAVQHLSSIKKNDEYGTPKDLFRHKCAQYNIYPVLDVAASHTNHVTDKYYTREDDAFHKPWNEDFFMNPEYSRVGIWMEAAYRQHQFFNVNALILVYAKTDTNWWYNWVESKREAYPDKVEVHFQHHRIRFNDEFGNPTKNSAPYPSAWIIYRK